VPCVATKIATEGMSLIDGTNVCEGNEPHEIARAIVSLHEDAVLWQRIADAGYELAVSEYSVANVANCLTDTLRSIGVDAPYLSKDQPWDEQK
jgi:O-antigen biosynthesis protein